MTTLLIWQNPFQLLFQTHNWTRRKHCQYSLENWKSGSDMREWNNGMWTISGNVMSILHEIQAVVLKGLKKGNGLSAWADWASTTFSCLSVFLSISVRQHPVGYQQPISNNSDWDSVFYLIPIFPVSAIQRMSHSRFTMNRIGTWLVGHQCYLLLTK